MLVHQRLLLQHLIWDDPVLDVGDEGKTILHSLPQAM